MYPFLPPTQADGELEHDGGHLGSDAVVREDDAVVEGDEVAAAGRLEEEEGAGQQLRHHEAPLPQQLHPAQSAGVLGHLPRDLDQSELSIVQLSSWRPIPAHHGLELLHLGLDVVVGPPEPGQGAPRLGLLARPHQPDRGLGQPPGEAQEQEAGHTQHDGVPLDGDHQAQAQSCQPTQIGLKIFGKK